MSSQRQTQKSYLHGSHPCRESMSRCRPCSRQSRENNVARLVAILRRITMAVQVIPFVYTGLFVILFSSYYLFPGDTMFIINYLFFVSPIIVLAHLVYSRMLMLCKWHRRACALPLIPQSVDLFDTYVCQLGNGAFVVAVITIFITMIAFMFCIYKVFFTDDGRIC